MTINYKQKWVQDLPPPGGFPALEYGRQTPKMISGYKLFGATFLIMGVGTYIYLRGRIQDLQDDDVERVRLSKILPIVQAENDIMFLGAAHKNVYLTRWMPPIVNNNGLYRFIPREYGAQKETTHHH
ncbi:GRIM-19 domain-containing protein [Heterostelium album PN500]|uniref:NADH dehydrogenase [ubiquinone] 1 alpha subcomplex subunit 13 n=1 Tax=Heterostelium pallidum (strain ATCC 26659 / Pp 5 / PN500) TaxID=670386 RepID=D3BQ44_HETP5|nr:GRIM-19 domain-containing protein [Heterostelium album PN500]EFA76595.1 GRIM-19 domain-containing protein [Heterostelium album PN500]|eukprot:XP_020428727.1 GRIM-19 domain-containing protein [Heterostelium album PN500]